MESVGDFMEDHAVGTTRIESYTPQVESVEAGHLAEGAEYATYRSRGTTDWLLIQTLAGAGRIGIDGDEVIVGPDSVALLRPGTHPRLRLPP